MIFASCRRDFTSTMFLSDLQIQERGGFLTLSQLGCKLGGKRVAILVHGYRVKFEDAQTAYALLEKRIADLGYDEVIGFFWPGSAIALGFFPAISRANSSGEALATLLSTLNLAGCRITVETHSLGARVALQALRLGCRCDELILTAPAVDDGVLAPGGEYCISTVRCGRIAILYSQNDPVLRHAYPIAELILEFRRVHALGLDGPEIPAPFNATPYDLSAEIHEHSEYKDRQRTYDIWRETLLRKG